MKRIIFTGGHHNSALTVAKALKKRGYQIYWLGHKITMRGEKSLSLEYQEVKKAKIPFFELKTGKFHQSYHPLNFLKIVFGLGQSFFLLLKLKSQLIVSFGGYLSFPVVLSAKVLGKKVIIHEQTRKAGLANRLLSPLADQIFLTWSASQKFFPPKKTETIGLPLNREVFLKKKTKLFPNLKKPIILITGGKQGSHAINKTIEKILPQLLEKYSLIHQAGGLIKTGDFLRLSKKRKKLKSSLRKKYHLKKFFFDQAMIKAMRQADLVIGRAGAHTVYELISLGKPAILIPLPFSYNQEQLANASFLAKYKAALILEQKQLTPSNLFKKINLMMKNILSYQENAAKLKGYVKKDALEKMVNFIEKILKQK